MAWFGLVLLLLTLVLTLASGWPSYAVVLGLSAAGAALGWLGGGLDPQWLASLPERVVGLLEHDLLQALALFALVGALLDRLGLADSLYQGLQRHRRGAGLSTLLLGALLAPLNGSVGASVQALARATAADWQREPPPPARGTAWLAVGGSLGVIVPPSIVLLLLGDAMLRAHTEGLNIAARHGLAVAQAGMRVMNTQDLLQAALVPGAMLLIGWCLIARWATGPGPAPAAAAPSMHSRTLLVVPPLLVVMLALVASGRVRAVEGAACAGLALLAWGLVSRRLDGRLLRLVLDDALALTGALFGLLIAATTLSLLLRAFGTDVLVQDGLRALDLPPTLRMLVVLLGLLACAAALDAYEMIFLVVPIVMPPLLSQVADAPWAATLTLLVLQLGFILPPFGMALVLARAQSASTVASRAVARAVLPYVAWSLVVLLTVLAWPACTTWTRSHAATLDAPVLQGDDVDRALRDMAAPRRGQP